MKCSHIEIGIRPMKQEKYLHMMDRSNLQTLSLIYALQLYKIELNLTFMHFARMNITISFYDPSLIYLFVNYFNVAKET